METETQRAEKESLATEPQPCPSCNAALVDGMRFCRQCGYRLGEGMAEYVETVRFDGMPNMGGGMGHQEGPQTMSNAAGAQTTFISPPPTTGAQSLSSGRRRRKGKRWMVVLLLLIVLVPLVAVGSTFLITAIRDVARERVGGFQSPDQPHSFFGASEFGDAEGDAGALLEGAMPGSPAERAGLIDGDVITKFDGTLVTGEDALRDVLRGTPIGKTVEVIYVRDGETLTTQLTTISNADYDSDAFMPKERGLMGIDDLDRVPVEGTKIHGVRLGDVYDNRPADLAGLKEGDIVVKFGDKPVRTPEGLSGHINASKPASTIPVTIYRNGQLTVIEVKMGRRT